MNQRSRVQTPQRSTRRQKARDARRRLILQTAEEVFSTGGYHEASLGEIAQRSELAVGTIYLYFADKADLYGTLVMEKMDDVVARLEEALTSDASASKCLRAAVHSQFSFHDANRTFFEIFLHQHQLQSSPLHERHWENMEELKRRNLSAIVSCIRRGQTQKELRRGDPKLMAVAFLGMTLQMIRQWIREKDPGRLTDLADIAANCFLHGAVRPVSDPS